MAPTSGWYRDPADELRLRLWDGAAWTGQTRPFPPPESTAQTPPSVALPASTSPETSSSAVVRDPGWYPDPQVPTQLRYWDGTAWGPVAPPTSQPIANGAPSRTGLRAPRRRKGGPLSTALALIGVALMIFAHATVLGALFMVASLALGGRWFFFMW